MTSPAIAGVGFGIRVGYSWVGWFGSIGRFSSGACMLELKWTGLGEDRRDRRDGSFAELPLVPALVALLVSPVRVPPGSSGPPSPYYPTSWRQFV